ncbi:unnamed protein product, partial [Scytosiphon promiscuus]
MENGPKRWVPDEEAIACFLCSRSFDVTTRRHHCRCCGRVACAACTPGKALVPLNDVVYPPSDSSMSLADFDPREAQRVCRECEHVLAPMQTDLQQTMTHSAMPTQHSRASVERYLNSPVTFDMTSEIVKAANTLLNFTSDNAIEGADSIPKDLIADARGLAFITFVKAGLFVTARVGTGLVVARRRDGGWSAPSALGSFGLGWGFQVGGELTDVVIVLNTVSAVEAFTSTGQLSLGTELSLSVGPVGRTASTDIRAGDGGVTAAFSYAHSKGVFIGVSLEAATVVTRKDTNRDFYGAKVSAEELLLGDVPPPKAAEPLYKALEEVRYCHGSWCSCRIFGAGNVWRGAELPVLAWGLRVRVRAVCMLGCLCQQTPNAEDHLRNFAVSPDERKQMEEDYRLALAMQKGEAVAAASTGTAGAGEACPVVYNFRSLMGEADESTHFFFASSHRARLSPLRRRGEEDEWELERRARIEKARTVEAEQTVTADNELGEIGSFLNGGGGG